MHVLQGQLEKPRKSVENLTSARSFIILCIEYASLQFNMVVHLINWNEEVAKEKKTLATLHSQVRSEHNFPYVKVTARGRPSGIATTTIVTFKRKKELVSLLLES